MNTSYFFFIFLMTYHTKLNVLDRAETTAGQVIIVAAP